MQPHVLVAFASRHGSTAEVAKAVARRLAERGLTTETVPVTQVGGLTQFDAVVLGTALYMGRAHKDARRFLHRWERDLASVPFAVFGMGPLTTSAHDLEGSRRQLDRALAATPLVDPFAVTVFGGVVEPDKLPFPLSRMTATDARDWVAINAWADEVAERIAVGMPLAAA